MSSGMVTVCTCWVVILLTTFPSRAFVGRHLVPAGPPAVSSAVQKAPGAVPEQVEDSRHVGSGGALQSTTLEHAGTQFQDSATPPPHRKILAGLKEVKKAKAGDSIYGHRLLVGSSPPTCQGKCGACNPCSPIHVSIGSPHGALTQQEYYPEVWRCKCGNRLFMP